VLFEALYKNKPSDCDFRVVNIARNDISRKGMEVPSSAYQFPNDLLFDDFIEMLPKLKKVKAVISYIKNYKPDLINIGGWGIDLSITLALVYCKISGIKTVISTETTATDHSRGSFKEKLKYLLMAHVRGFVCFGSRAKAYILDLGFKENQILSEKSAVVDDQEIQRQYAFYKQQEPLEAIKTKRNLVFVGRLVDVKNIDLLLSAFQEVQNDIPEWGLIILGNGEEEYKLKPYLETKDSRFYHFDSVDWRTVPQFYAQADCIVLCSYSEAWGLVINEAMLCGLVPIVTDRCGCAPDLAENVGLVVKSNDKEQLKNAILKVTQDNAFREAAKQRALERVALFKVDAVAQEIWQGFSKILNEK
jgi:glycosyltransferase involved in cell wall biosynthesis